MKYKVGLLYDSVSKNSGDEAIGIAMEQVLSRIDDIQVEVINPFDFDEQDYSKIIVGGGQLIRGSGDPFYDKFRIKGKHILNAAGLSMPVDSLEYLDEYDFVSTRTNEESRVVSKYTTKVRTIPDITTLMSHEEYDIKGLNKNETVVGVHVVPYTYQLCPEIVEIINAIPYKKVFIPFTHYIKDKNFMMSLPFDFSNAIILDNLSPTELHSVIGQMDYVVVSSLHASIFAYTQNIPFATLGQEKVRMYFADRGLSDFVFVQSDKLQKIINKFETDKPDYTDLIAKDKKKLNETIDEYVSLIKSTSARRNNSNKNPKQQRHDQGERFIHT
ncbi:MAG: polysaccharide pyruvyl transferase family protein [Erysipelotrichia bacterium]|nr:polysaccharide pyruvyl transferase family protein [Erysipelotrichia bacterium]